LFDEDAMSKMADVYQGAAEAIVKALFRWIHEPSRHSNAVKAAEAIKDILRENLGNDLVDSMLGRLLLLEADVARLRAVFDAASKVVLKDSTLAEFNQLVVAVAKAKDQLRTNSREFAETDSNADSPSRKDV